MPDNLESRVEMNKTRVALNAIKGGLLGACFSPGYYLAPALAVAGAGLTVYDEVKNAGLNFSRPFWGVLVGGLIGSFFDINANDYVPYIATYAGIGIGGGLGVWDAYRLGKDSF